jgi:hypothetical protein
MRQDVAQTGLSPGRRRSGWWGGYLIGAVLLALTLGTRQAVAQIDSAYIRSFPNGPQTSIDTEDGVRCSANAGTRPYVTFFGGYDGVPDNGVVFNNNSTVNSLGTGAIGGVAVTIPLGSSALGNCDRLRQLQEARSALGLANQMFEAGLITDKELKALGDELKPMLLGTDWKKKSEGQTDLEVPAKPAPASQGTPVPVKQLDNNNSGTANPSRMSMSAEPVPAMSLGPRLQSLRSIR